MEKENKIELECDYCHLPITEKDHKCPNCGADCSAKIKKYKAQKAKEEEAEKERMIAQSNAIQKAMNAPVKFIIGIAIAIIIFIIVIFVVTVTGVFRGKEIQQEQLNGGYQEEVKQGGLTCSLDSYEYYTYVSDKFPDQYNTPKGYQKIAFHLVCENTGKSKAYLSPFDVSLTADDFPVEDAELKTGMFEEAVDGEASYPLIVGNYIRSNEKLQGYVGFLVPKDKKELKLKIKDMVITMDNPAYEE